MEIGCLDVLLSIFFSHNSFAMNNTNNPANIGSEGSDNANRSSSD